MKNTKALSDARNILPGEMGLFCNKNSINDFKN